MKNIIFILLASSLLVLSCKTAQNLSGGERDGSSFAKAIVIDKDNSMDGIAAEYAWIRNQYPGSKSLGQALVFHKKKPYDIIKILTAEGVEKSVYFDISKFFGKL
jgi:predicted small secreted protein